MASDKNQPQAAATTIPAFNPDLVNKGLVNLAAKYPIYAGGDARVGKVGTKGPPIHGYLLGTVDLPSVIKDPNTGEAKAWRGIVVELIQPAPVKEKHGEEEIARMALKGERIILTESKALEAYSHIADHGSKVFEAMIVPMISKTKLGQSLWVFPEFKVGNPVQRTEQRMVGTAMFEESPETQVHPALPVSAGPSNHGSHPRA